MRKYILPEIIELMSKEKFSSYWWTKESIRYHLKASLDLEDELDLLSEEGILDRNEDPNKIIYRITTAQ